MPRFIRGGIRLSPLSRGPHLSVNPLRNKLGIRPGQAVEATMLEEYRVERGLTVGALAGKIGVSRNGLRKWLLGSQIPSLMWAYRVEEVTGGEVPVVSWLGTKLGSAIYRELEEVAEQRGLRIGGKTR